MLSPSCLPSSVFIARILSLCFSSQTELQQQEELLYKERKERESVIASYRKKVEERKAQAEKVDRRVKYTDDTYHTHTEPEYHFNIQLYFTGIHAPNTTPVHLWLKMTTSNMNNDSVTLCRMKMRHLHLYYTTADPENDYAAWWTEQRAPAQHNQGGRWRGESHLRFWGGFPKDQGGHWSHRYTGVDVDCCFI